MEEEIWGRRGGGAGWRKPRYTRSLPGWLARAFQLRILEPQAAKGLTDTRGGDPHACLIPGDADYIGGRYVEPPAR